MTTELTSRPLNVNSLTPRQIVEALDRYVIGQHDAKRMVAIALRNRWRSILSGRRNSLEPSRN